MSRSNTPINAPMHSTDRSGPATGKTSPVDESTVPREAFVERAAAGTTEAPDAAPLLAVDVTLRPPGSSSAVLSGVRFDLQRGRTYATLGLSGSGKSVLLQLLAGRLDLAGFGFTGSLRAPALLGPGFEAAQASSGNAATDAEMTLRALAPRISYVPPDDVVFGFDTPREAVVFRHRLAFGSSREEAEAVAATLIADLGLEKCADNLIAPGVGLRGISGGQRRRTVIAMALATQPDILILDEPTTGLDSTTAKQVMATVQGLARRYGCAVLQSLQQPGADLFPHFDELVMLSADGTLEFAGATLDGPASVPKAHVLRARAAEEAEGAGSIAEAAGAHEPATPGARSATGATGQQRSAFALTTLLLARHVRGLARNPLALGMRIGQTLFVGLFFGLVFLNTDMHVDNFKQILGLLMVLVTSTLITVQTAAALFPLEKPVFLEEQRLPFRYPAAAYLVTKTMVESLAAFPLSVAFAAIAGGLIGFPGDVVGKLCLTILLQSAAGEGFGFFVSTIAPAPLSIGVIVPVVAFAMMTVGTSLAAGGAEATADLFDALKYMTFLRNGFAAIAVDVLPLVKGPCTQAIGCFFPSGAAAAHFYDVDSTSVGREWGLLVAWFAFYRGLAMIALTALGWRQRTAYDAERHRRTPAQVDTEEHTHVHERVAHDPVIEADTSVELQPARGHTAVPAAGGLGLGASVVSYAPYPSAASLSWDVEFEVRPRWGEGSQTYRTILQRMCGTAHAGRALAIMGGSGAGKSTLLEGLSLALPGSNVFTETHRACEIRVEPATGSAGAVVGAEARCLIAIVHQYPEFVEGLSVEESVRFAVDASLRALGGDEGAVPDAAFLTRELLRELGLEHVGSAAATKLSGSQRKRLAVAIALAQRRPILMLDEPTSGLDPESALQLLRLLQHLAATRGLTVLYTLHQPGDELLPHIDDLLLLSAGRVVYHGPLAEADSGAFGAHPRPAGLNATDHYLQLSQTPGTVEELVAAWTAGGKSQPKARSASEAEQERGRAAVAGLIEHYRGLGRLTTGFRALVRRSFTSSVLRVSPVMLVLRFVAMWVLMPVIVGLSMYDKAADPVSLQNACFVTVMAVGFASATVPILDLHLERIVFLREQEADQYSAVAYYAARSLAALPLEVFGVLCSCSITYFMVGLHNDAGSFLLFVFLAVCVQQAAVGMGYALGVTLHSLVVSAAMSTMIQILLATGCGVFIAPQRIDDSRWLHSVEFSSPMRQAMLLMMRNELRHVEHGDAVLEQYLGFDRAWDKPEYLWPLLIAMVVGTRVAAGLAFKFMTRGTKTDDGRASIKGQQPAEEEVEKPQEQV